MVLKTSFTTLVVATLAAFSSYTPQAEAHSWAECVDWKFNKGGKQDWSDEGGKCLGYARRFPLNQPFGSLDSWWPARHYVQDSNNPNFTMPCNHYAYGGQFGRMTVTSVGDTLCARWPAKNHAVPVFPGSHNTILINLSKTPNSKDVSQAELMKNTIATLKFNNCNSVYPNTDRRACGGCFKVPPREKGTYLLQWRWLIEDGKAYTSCADIQI
ncbi:hypothetical protein BGZ95_006946, partial [Linnemannia exigua]